MNQKTKYYGIIVGGILLLIVASILWKSQVGNSSGMVLTEAGENTTQESESILEEEATEEEEVEEEEPSSIYVYVCGAVVQEGVYEVETGTRLYQVIELAGGLLEDAAAESINQAILLEDGQQIIIYTKEELEEQIQQEASSGLVNINLASVEQLCQLSGIGESRANDIVAYRDAYGSFATNEDIMNVTGIKEGTYDQIKDYITVD
ncbi:MAG: helix-hairpin-helix domain-containing protein [Eubacteriales bacterium]